MDEVPIATTNPVNKLIKPEKPTPKPQKRNQIVESLKNLVYMAPLGFIAVLQLYYLGQSCGRFTTFPYTSFTSFIILATLGVILFFIQMLQRSIVYSVLSGLALVSGIFTAWFGDFFAPVSANFQNIDEIIKAAWMRKDIPYHLLISGIMTFILAGIAGIQFLLSLFIKSFFETFFGKTWGDGKWLGFAGAIGLLAGVHLSFYFYSDYSSNYEDRLIWEFRQKYKPAEKFLTDTPGSIMFNNENVWTSHNGYIRRITADKGRVSTEKPFKSVAIRPGFQFSTNPVFFNEEGIHCYNESMNIKLWANSYPASFTTLKTDTKPEKSDYYPQTSYMLNSSNQLLVYYKYGFLALYDMKNGRQLWLRQIDQPYKTGNIFDKNSPSKEFIYDSEKILIVSCFNAIVKAVDKQTGKTIWEYSHPNLKFNGKPQKGYLTATAKRLLVAYKSGELVTLSLKNGKVIYRGKNESFCPITAPSFDGLKANILSEQGFFFEVEVDGGKILNKFNLLSKKLDFMPVVSNMKKGIVAHKNQIFKVDDNQAKLVAKIQNRIFITRPVFDEKLMYIGTQDGWVYCIHHGSFDEKFHIHVNGELDQNSLQIAGNRLLVKTKSGSIVSLNRMFSY
ncbi:MAG: PQQ-binding-like beta-propeller repeat protein [Candidatus Rifleibacteriota bacterium]